MTMSVKRGTTNNAALKQEQNFKNDGANNTDAAEFQKAFGDQKLGDVLNKMSDKNWTDPTKKMRTSGNPNLDKDAFFKMMLAQMKNQDPTKPLESHEMAAQIAQFSSVEQLNNIHGVLGDMAKAQQPNTSYQALALIGKTVSGDSSKLSRVAGDTTHEVKFELLNDATKAQATIRDTGGNIVKTMELGSLKKGANEVSWNGLGEDGIAIRPGEYHVAIEAKNASGQKVYAKTSFEGRISGMNFTPEGPVLLVGKQTLRMSDIKKIEETLPEKGAGVPAMPIGPKDFAANTGGMFPPPGPSQGALPGLPPGMKLPPGMSLTPPPGTPAAQAQQAIAQAQQTIAPAQQKQFIPPAEDPIPKMVGNIEDVPMAQGLLNRIEKETR